MLILNCAFKWHFQFPDWGYSRVAPGKSGPHEMARGSSSLLSSHGRVIGPQDGLKKDSRGLSRVISERDNSFSTWFDHLHKERVNLDDWKMTERPHLVFTSDGQWPVRRMIRLCAGLVGRAPGSWMTLPWSQNRKSQWVTCHRIAPPNSTISQVPSGSKILLCSSMTWLKMVTSLSKGLSGVFSPAPEK